MFIFLLREEDLHCVSDDIKIFVKKLKYVCSKQYFDISLNFYEVSCFPYFSLNISNNKIYLKIFNWVKICNSINIEKLELSK